MESCGIPILLWKQVWYCSGIAIWNLYPYLSIPISRYTWSYLHLCHALLRRKIEGDEKEYDEFGRVSPLQFSFSPSSTPVPSLLALPPVQLPPPVPHIPALQPQQFPLPNLHPPQPQLEPHACTRPLPPGCAPYQEALQRHSLGPMNVECPHYQALHFDCEKLSESTQAVPKFGSCCLPGQIRLPPFSCAPATLQDLLCGKSPLSKEFETNIQQYNAAFAFTSLGVKVDEEVTQASEPYSFQWCQHHLDCLMKCVHFFQLMPTCLDFVIFGEYSSLPLLLQLFKQCFTLMLYSMFNLDYFSMEILCQSKLNSFSSAFLEACQVWQPTLNLRWSRKTRANYLHCMRVGTISYYKNKE
jgi:hypothetical protein